MKKMVSCTALFSLTLAAGTLGAAMLTPAEHMGKLVYQDKDLSYNSTQSCATCHHRSAGFADPSNARDPYNTMVSLGDDGYSKGGRNSPTASYTGYSPNLHLGEDGKWYGGMFWDGRATGWTMGDPLAEQAQGPPLNPVEMNMPSIEAVVEAVAQSGYSHLFSDMYGEDFFVHVTYAFDMIARHVATYERSPELNPFSSRYDRGTLSGQERRGFSHFTNNCGACHSLDAPPGADGPVFTSYGYANIGVPLNEALANDPQSVYAPPDLGLGPVVEDPAQDGKFKIPTLRNVAQTPPYSHNGYFATLRAMVAFHNDNSQFVPEVGRNLSPLVGDMGLTDEEINDIVAFLYALTDEKSVNRAGKEK